MKNEKKFPKSPIGLFYVGFIWVISLGLVILISHREFEMFVSTLELPESWLRIVFLDSVIIVSGIFATSEMIQQYLTVITENYIRRPSFIRYMTIKPQDVIAIDVVGYKIFIKSPKNWLVINLWLYKHPQEIVEYLRTWRKFSS